ncbi:hypothetical protein AJ78_04359 [Emergomyces pasteurianus Ep9510]|uniref:Uncharacterized protein n=1 Tax=Emergomyces pasteurianus Ep9510 TaxID=1447872 RepID=A0A1J9QJK2_9EURO|nr:hypothetical protein AJ78_04359 [Emergomyces pasteurianus Ep9510]
MFDRRHPETGEPDDRYLIAQFAAILGPPPVEIWSQSKLCQAFWDENGDVTYHHRNAPNINLYIPLYVHNDLRGPVDIRHDIVSMSLFVYYPGFSKITDQRQSSFRKRL